MKTAFTFITLAAGLAFITACSTSKEPAAESTPQENVPADPAAPLLNIYTCVVTEIQMGKDGYTAQMRTLQTGATIYATISRANLRAPETYRSAAIGDTLEVTGEEWQMENQTHLTVRELK